THGVERRRKLVPICSNSTDLESRRAERDVFATGPNVADLEQCAIPKGLLNVEVPLLHVGERLIRNSALDALTDELAQFAFISTNRLQQWHVRQRIAQGASEG